MEQAWASLIVPWWLFTPGQFLGGACCPLEPKRGGWGGNWTRSLISIENSFSFYFSFSSHLLLTHPDLSLTFSLSFLPCDAIFPSMSVITNEAALWWERKPGWAYTYLPHTCQEGAVHHGAGVGAGARELSLFSVSRTQLSSPDPSRWTESWASCAFGEIAGPSLPLLRCCDSERVSELPFSMAGLTHVWCLWPEHLLTKAIKECQSLKWLFWGLCQ